MPKHILLVTRLCNIALDGRVSTVYTTTFVYDGEDSSLLNSQYAEYKDAHALCSKGYLTHLNDVYLEGEVIDEPLAFECITEVVTCARIRKCDEIWLYNNLGHTWSMIADLAVSNSI